jgi:hypothetical protein
MKRELCGVRDLGCIKSADILGVWRSRVNLVGTGRRRRGMARCEYKRRLLSREWGYQKPGIRRRARRRTTRLGRSGVKRGSIGMKYGQSSFQGHREQSKHFFRRTGRKALDEEAKPVLEVDDIMHQ